MLTGHQHESVPDVTGLVRDAQSGDKGAQNELIALHLPLVYNIVGRALYTAADVDDVVQEAMLRIVRGLPGLREPDRFRSWAVAVTYRQIQQHARRRAADARPREDLTGIADPSSDFAERSVAELVLSGQRRDLAGATRLLEPADRQLLALWWQEASGQLTRAEVAAALAVDPPHAAVRIRRMKVRLEAARTVVRALAATPRCPALAAVTREWDGGSTPVWRKRLTRHIRECEQCRTQGNGLVAPEKLLPAFAVLLVPHGVLGSLQSMADTAAAAGRSPWGTFGAPWPRLTAKTATAGAAAAVAVTAAVVFVLSPWTGPAPSAGGVSTVPAGRPTASASGAPPASPPSPARTTAPRTASPAGVEPATRTGGLTSADLYMAPNGSDSGDGSLAHPFATLGKAVAAVRPGQSIALRGGTYRMTDPVTITTSGTSAHRITLSNYRDEHPALDASGLPANAWGITQSSSYWTVQGLEIFGSTSHAYVCRGCRYDVFRRLSSHDNARSGLTLRDDGTVGNSVLDSDFFGNHEDSEHGGAGVGLAVTFGSGKGNVIRGCRTFDNATEGMNLGGFASPVVVESNWSYGNGVNRWGVADWQPRGNGFTLGGGNSDVAVAHLVSNNAAWDNTGLGFNDEGNPGRMRLTGNTAFRNGSTGFYLPDAAAVLQDNAAAGNARNTLLGGESQSEGNTWDTGDGVTPEFTSTDPATAQADRPAGGALPRTTFLVSRDAVGATMSEKR